ncbi:hypothetical protein J7I44_09985 [Frateuria sp. MAH-13]|uniref:DUF3352 domain-containing protein n=1 Tax=Frateuria flava TaxID=2821489 RepID=A0ABS4DNN9_9GAMM|nr:hypothetical protein [Frateuria flava]MBP1474630.1 hypothetical protein [Frateuria flava]
MRSTKRTLALALAGLLLAACGHKDKDAPLAFVPADTPYVVANLDVLDDNTRAALLAQADAQMPAEVTQLRAAADEMAAKDPDTANLLRAFAKELDGKSVETFAQGAGLDLKGYSALYGLGLAPVLRFQLSDSDAFEAFVGRLEAAYGKKLDVANLDKQSYRRHVSAATGTQLILAVVGKQAVAAILPADASQPLLRQALGLDRPSKNLQDEGRLAKLAKTKGYEKWAVGELDLTRALPLAASGKDPLFNALLRARAQAESAKTGEPVSNQLQIPPSCEADATRIASRVPELSFGYTRLEAKHQDMRWDVSLASDITQAFGGLKVDLPGLGAMQATSPFEFFLGLPVAQVRTFWSAQADAVAAKPFTCPALTDLNDTFAKLGQNMQKAAIPPFGDLLGLGLSLDSFAPGQANAMPQFTGRLVLGTSNPAGLLAMGQMMTPALAQLKLTADGKPAALPPALANMVGQPAWLAMGPKSLGLGIGAGEDGKLADALKAPIGNAGQMLRMHLSGQMYLDWVTLMQQKADSLASAAAALGKDDAASTEDQVDKAAAEARTKAQFDAMRAQAARIESIDADAHVDDHGLTITSQTTLK